MAYKKLTHNFSYFEFRPKGTPKSWLPTSEYQDDLLKNLAENLQVVRESLPVRAYMKVTSGVRSPEDYQRLIDAGYHPSKTSDHNFGYAVPLDEGTSKYKKFGPTYNFSIGAADIVSVHLPVRDLFEVAVAKTKAGLCHFGQVIYEKNPNTGAEWVHFGGDPRPFFAPHIIHLFGRLQFLETLDGGKNYKVIIP